MIAIVDYGMGNVRSIYNALQYLGQDAEITADPRRIDNASHLILPGVGAFGDAIANIRRAGIDEILSEQVQHKGKPLLGICLGLQLLSKCSEEHGTHEGLGWFDARVIRFRPNGHRLHIPHMGWNDIQPRLAHQLFTGLGPDQFTFYFVHSFHIVCADARDSIANCDYGIEFPAAIGRENVVATQFHPEKSQDNGLHVLQNFVKWRP